MKQLNRTERFMIGEIDEVAAYHLNEEKKMQIAIIDAEIMFKVNRKELVERIEFVSTKANVPMKLTLDDALTMSIRGINAVTESMRVDWISKKPLEIAFNPKYVLEALKSSNDEVICIAMNSSLTPMIITFSTGKELVLPIRINND